MTAAQASILQGLCERTGIAFDPNHTRSEADALIAELRTQAERLDGPGAGDNPDMS